jgi:uncharacterized protein (DUF1778 family)
MRQSSDKNNLESGKDKQIQMKILLNTKEHAVVTLAANVSGENVGDYMKKVLIERAKEDSREFLKTIDNI